MTIVHYNYIQRLRELQADLADSEFNKPETKLKVYRDIDDICLKLVADSQKIVPNE